MPSSPAISATAVLAKPSLRNSASAVSMIRARVSSGLVLVCAFMGRLHLTTDECYNSSVQKVKAGPLHGMNIVIPAGRARLKEREGFAADAGRKPARHPPARQIDDMNAAVTLARDEQRNAMEGGVHRLPADAKRRLMRERCVNQ